MAEIPKQEGFLVPEDYPNVQPKWSEFVLLAGSLVVQHDDSSFSKVAPGVMIVNLQLTSEQKARLKPVKFSNNGLEFYVSTEEATHSVEGV